MRLPSRISFKKLDYNRFEVDFKYNPKIIRICKSIPGRKFNIDNKNWSFPINQYINLIKKLDDSLIEFKNKLTKKEINDIQVVIYSEPEEPELLVSFPPHDEIKKVVKDLGGEMIEDQFCWTIDQQKAKQFLDQIEMMKIKTIKYEEPPLSN